MAISYQLEGVERPDISDEKINEWIEAVLGKYDKTLGEICYIFCNDEKILEVNQEYLDHDYYTDIISFDYTVGGLVSGDMLISLDTVKTNSEDYKTNYMEELHRVMIHGILHLCGFGDSTEEEQIAMREMENTALAQLAP